VKDSAEDNRSNQQSELDRSVERIPGEPDFFEE